jgi:hypothetical protein
MGEIKGINEIMVGCLKTLYDDVQCCVNWSYEEVTSVKQVIGVRQGCLSPYLFNIIIIINDIIGYIREKSTHSPIVGNQTIRDSVCSWFGNWIPHSKWLTKGNRSYG